MGDVLLNGRKPKDFEVAAVERGRDCERTRGLELLAGVLTSAGAGSGGGPDGGVRRPVADLPGLP